MTKEYKVISSDNEKEFNIYINKALDEGWELYGNLVVFPVVSIPAGHPTPSSFRYFREIVRDIKNSPK
jgi:hypothetical protein